jgi:hypothetical protein
MPQAQHSTAEQLVRNITHCVSLSTSTGVLPIMHSSCMHVNACASLTTKRVPGRTRACTLTMKSANASSTAQHSSTAGAQHHTLSEPHDTKKGPVNHASSKARRGAAQHSSMAPAHHHTLCEHYNTYKTGAHNVGPAHFAAYQCLHCRASSKNGQCVSRASIKAPPHWV